MFLEGALFLVSLVEFWVILQPNRQLNFSWRKQVHGCLNDNPAECPGKPISLGSPARGLALWDCAHEFQNDRSVKMDHTHFSHYSSRKFPGLQRFPVLCTYHQQSKHGLPHIESVSPVVISDGAVPFPHGVHPSGKNLWPKGDNTTQTLE